MNATAKPNGTTSPKVVPARNPFEDKATGNWRQHERLEAHLIHNIGEYRLLWNEQAARSNGVKNSSRTRHRLGNGHWMFLQRVALRWRNQAMLAIAEDSVVCNAVAFNRLTASEYLPVGVYEKRYSWEEICARTIADYRDRAAFTGVLVAETDNDSIADRAERNSNNLRNNTTNTADDVLASRYRNGKAYAQCETVEVAPYMKRYLLNPSLIPWAFLPKEATVLGRVNIDGEVVVMAGRLSDWGKLSLPYELGIDSIDQLKKWRISPVHITSISLEKENKKETGNPFPQDKASLCEAENGQLPENQPLSELPKVLESAPGGRAAAADVENPVEKPGKADIRREMVEMYLSLLIQSTGGRYDMEVLRRSANRAMRNWQSALGQYLEGREAAMLAAIQNLAVYSAQTGFKVQQLPHNFFTFSEKSGIYRAMTMHAAFVKEGQRAEAAAEKALAQKHAKVVNLTGKPIDRKQIDILERDAKGAADPRNHTFSYTDDNGKIRQFDMYAGKWITETILPRLREMHKNNRHAVYVLSNDANLHAWYDAIVEMRKYAEILVSKTANYAPGTFENFTLASRMVRAALAWWLQLPAFAQMDDLRYPGLEWFKDREIDYKAGAKWRKKFAPTGLITDHSTGQPLMEKFFADFLLCLNNQNKKHNFAKDFSVKAAMKMVKADGWERLSEWVKYLQARGMQVYYMAPAENNPLGFTMVDALTMRKYQAANTAYYQAHCQMMEKMGGEVAPEMWS